MLIERQQLEFKERMKTDIVARAGAFRDDDLIQLRFPYLLVITTRPRAMRQGWGGRPVRQEQAQGMLVAALGLLAAHYGFSEAKNGLLREMQDRRRQDPSTGLARG